jgi:uncharacterized membrane protein
MSWSTLIMYGVAGLALLLGLFVVTRRAPSEAAVYRRRITATMLLALSLILAVFATVFHEAGGVA